MSDAVIRINTAVRHTTLTADQAQRLIATSHITDLANAFQRIRQATPTYHLEQFRTQLEQIGELVTRGFIDTSTESGMQQLDTGLRRLIEDTERLLGFQNQLPRALRAGTSEAVDFLNNARLSATGLNQRAQTLLNLGGGGQVPGFQRQGIGVTPGLVGTTQSALTQLAINA